ncbi:hypothetical protein [Staphylococcus shinii]|uniref:hypothetical protein n=1 Tax=Staphylococcus shinii TaxID=2912228 RepID=UPI003F578D5A
MNIITKGIYNIDKWIRPYAYVFENKQEIQTKEKRNRKPSKQYTKKKKVKLSAKEEKEKAAFLKTGAIGIKLVNVPKVMTRKHALERLTVCKPQIAYYCHEQGHHQIAVKFEKGSAWKYHERNEKKRKNLIPIIEHKIKGKGDKTHIIPVGFHGSENDERLLIRFDSKINRGALKKSEELVAKLNEEQSILWFVDVVKQQDNTAIWNMTVWSENYEVLVEKSFHDYNKFLWVE